MELVFLATRVKYQHIFKIVQITKKNKQNRDLFNIIIYMIKFIYSYIYLGIFQFSRRILIVLFLYFN